MCFSDFNSRYKMFTKIHMKHLPFDWIWSGLTRECSGRCLNTMFRQRGMPHSPPIIVISRATQKNYNQEFPKIWKTYEINMDPGPKIWKKIWNTYENNAIWTHSHYFHIYFILLSYFSGRFISYFFFIFPGILDWSLLCSPCELQHTCTQVLPPWWRPVLSR